MKKLTSSQRRQLRQERIKESRKLQAKGVLWTRDDFNQTKACHYVPSVHY